MLLPRPSFACVLNYVSLSHCTPSLLIETDGMPYFGHQGDGHGAPVRRPALRMAAMALRSWSKRSYSERCGSKARDRTTPVWCGIITLRKKREN